MSPEAQRKKPDKVSVGKKKRGRPAKEKPMVKMYDDSDQDWEDSDDSILYWHDDVRDYDDCSSEGEDR